MPFRSLIPLALCLAASAAHAGPVNINTADVAQLDAELFGVGPVLAARIVAHRQQHGPYQSPEDLLQIQQIGQRFLHNNRGWIRLN